MSKIQASGQFQAFSNERPANTFQYVQVTTLLHCVTVNSVIGARDNVLAHAALAVDEFLGTKSMTKLHH
jgi:hypothetical protein